MLPSSSGLEDCKLKTLITFCAQMVHFETGNQIASKRSKIKAIPIFTKVLQIKMRANSFWYDALDRLMLWMQVFLIRQFHPYLHFSMKT